MGILSATSKRWHSLEWGCSRQTGPEADPFLRRSSIELLLRMPFCGSSRGSPGGAKRRQGVSRQTAPLADPFLRNSGSNRCFSEWGPQTKTIADEGWCWDALLGARSAARRGGFQGKPHP